MSSNPRCSLLFRILAPVSMPFLVWNSCTVNDRMMPRYIFSAEYCSFVDCACADPMTIYFDRLETVFFFCLFTRKGDMAYKGSDNTEHRGLKARVLPWLPSCKDKLEKRCEWACFALLWKLKGTFSTRISFPQAPDYTTRAVSNFFGDLRRYSELKVHHRCRWHRWW